MEYLRKPKVNYCFDLETASVKKKWSPFCLFEPMGNDVIVYNCLNGAMAVVSVAEFEGGLLFGDATLKEQLFFVADDSEAHAMADIARRRNLTPTTKTLGYDTFNNVTIFTTTKCNARCPYCFEGTAAGTDMNDATALKVVRLLKERGLKHYEIKWFGGEPLCNVRAMESICSGLRDARISYASQLVSNGFLLSPDIVDRLRNEFHVTKVSISMDGYGEQYNSVKNYIYAHADAYAVVMENIRGLISHGYKPVIRINLDLDNAQSVSQLLNDLYTRFGKNVKPYIFPVYQSLKSGRSKEDRMRLFASFKSLINNSPYNISAAKELSISPCSADSGGTMVILPDGNIGTCEHYPRNHFVGNVDRKDIDYVEVMKLREVAPNDLDCCGDCPLRPMCRRLKICTELLHSSDCTEELREWKIYRLRRFMRSAYRKYKKTQ